MNPHTDIFIARIFLRDSKGFIQTLEERLFASRNEAHAFLVEDFFGQETYTACRGEIVRFAGGKAEEQTLFDSTGSFVEDQHPEIPVLTPGFVPKYQVGDLVRLTNDYPYKYGVVSAIPPEYESIPEEIRAQQEAVYMVEYISERGTLGHTRPEEAYLEVVDTIPDGQEFLYMLSRHYKGEEKLPDDVFKAIIEGGIYLLPTRNLSDIGICLNNVKREPGYTCCMYSGKKIAVFDERAGLLLYDIESGKREYLGRLPNITRFSDIRLYSHAPYICVVEERGINGAVINAQTGATKELIRGSYHVEHCRYPIGFVQRGNELLLIHGTDWNRLDVMRLSDFANLTERTLTKESYDDYFHNLLNVSPGGTRFADNGWVWSPFDVIQVYELERFLTGYDQAFYSIESADQSSGYNWGRPLCWVDERTLAVGRNPNEGKETNDAIPHLPSTIELYDVTRVVEKPYRFADETGKVYSEGVWKYHPRTDTIVFDGFGCDPAYSEVFGDLYFDGKAQVFIGLNSDTGLLVGSRTGETLVKDETFKEYQYAPGFRSFYRYRYDKNSAEVIPLDRLIEK